MLIPAFKAAGATLHSLASAGGTSSVIHGRRNGFAHATSDAAALIADPQVNTVVVATRHDTHARFAAEALAAGKHVFVEKPLALTLDELAQVEVALSRAGRLLMVGFNRRFAPHVQRMKRLLDGVHEPKVFVSVMNAGAIPADNWTQDPAVGGGRIVGEACHHVDLMRFLAGSPIVSVHARRMGDNDAVRTTEDKAVIVLGFADGSLGTIHYLANGASSFPKERIEVFVGGRTLLLDNFLKLRGFNWPTLRSERLWRQNKGQNECAAAFLRAVATGGPSPIHAEELIETARATIEAANLLRAQR
jgi:predicted dehydrogenase